MMDPQHKLSPEVHAALAKAVSQYYDDPLGFVMFAFPWGRPTLPDGSPNPLKNKTGPEPWQATLLTALGNHIKRNGVNSLLGFDPEVWRSSVASGHGVGKSAMVAWLIIFFMSTRVDTRGVVTANTETQLMDRTWPELQKWHLLSLTAPWFTWTATRYHFALYSGGREKSYMFTAQTVSEQRPEAFAGLHNEGKTVVAIFDEASGVFDGLWDVVEGAMTDGEGFFFAKGNPTRPSGAFADTHGIHKDLYYTMCVDSRSVSHTNKSQIQHIIDKYGPDHDQVRIRVEGKFPKTDQNGFIDRATVEQAVDRDVDTSDLAPRILGIDVGDVRDETILICRQGNDARKFGVVCIPPVGNVPNRFKVLAEIIAGYIDDINPDFTVIENLGPGIGVVGALTTMGYAVEAVYPGAPAASSQAGGHGRTHTRSRNDSIDPEIARIQFYNERARYWFEAREWLYQGAIPNDAHLVEQLTDVRSEIDPQSNKLIMESKKVISKRRSAINTTTWRSPDRADALVLTFAPKTPTRLLDRHGRPVFRRGAKRAASGPDYDYDPLVYA